jgi:exosortase
VSAAEIVIENTASEVVGPSSRRSVHFSVALAVVVLASHLPLVLLHFYHLWMHRPHYQFFPLLLAAIAWLAWQRWPQWSLPAPAPWWSTGLLATGWTVLAAATVLWSPWLAAIALVLSIGGLIGRYAAPGQWRDWLPVWLVMWLVVPPPFRWDFQLIFWLQSSTSQMASRLLDLLRVLHLMEGHVLVLPGHRMLVDEACSGVNSVLVLLVLTALFVVTASRPLIWSVLLLLSSVAWAWAANVVRITTIALAQAWYQVDLSSGWRHELLGYITISLALIWLISTDYCLAFFLRPIILRRVDLSEFALEDSALSRAWNWFVGAGAKMYWGPVPSEEDDQVASEDPAEPDPEGQLVDPGPIRPGTYVWLGAFGLFGLLQLASFVVPGQPALVADLDSIRFEREDLPEELGGWTLVEFQPEERALRDRVALYSDEWLFRRGPLVCRVSIDYPFSDWHELTVCYRGTGWQVIDRRPVIDWQESGPDGPYVQVALLRQSGEYGWLVFGLFNQRGEAVTPLDAPEAHWPSVWEKLTRSPLACWLLGLRRRELAETTYQLQVFASGTVDLSPEQKDEVREFFLSFRAAVLAAHRGRLSQMERRP